jgi:GT2 family glycosyltransferase
MSAAVSVIVPVHGGARLTQRCLDMVLVDLPADAELIVVDDASPDETPQLLEGYGGAIRSVRLEKNGGFARACNEGAALAEGELLVFLNNDVEPMPGWLEALRLHAQEHSEAAAVGAKLLYPNGTVQHAGVVFGQDGYPHHLYAGFPADHPAVNRSRPLQAVTGACLLVRRGAFEAAGGFDLGYLNSLEDVDLCLRIGEAGGEVHYCSEAVLVHLESVSRGRSDRFERSVALYRERWRRRVHRDDCEIYAEDDLLRVEYPTGYPIRFEVDPLLAVVARDREEEIERLLGSYAGQVSDLLQEVTRLTALNGVAFATDRPLDREEMSYGPSLDHETFLARAHKIESEIRALQAGSHEGSDETSSSLGYRYEVEAVRKAVAQTVPAGAVVLVVSRGDRELLRLDKRTGWHFPRESDGRYSGYHPADAKDAIVHLEELRASGAGYLVFPSASAWWLDHYDDFTDYLEERYKRIEAEGCAIFQLYGEDAAENGFTLRR